MTTSSYKRVAAFRARQVELGYKRMDLYVHADDIERVQAYVAKLNKQREAQRANSKQ